MKQKMIVTTVALSFMLGATAWSAPKVVPPPLKAQLATPDEIRVENVNGESGAEETGMASLHSGGGESWVLRANDTASHFVTQTTFDTMQGAVDVNDAVGLMTPGTFNQMLGYLTWTRLLDQKGSARAGGGLQVTLKRGGKSKSVLLPYGSPLEATAASTTLTLLDSFTRNVVWKTAAQFKAGTGLAVIYQIDSPMDEKDTVAATAFPRPMFSVFNAAGKEVAVLRPNTDKERAAFLSSTPIYNDDWSKDKDIGSFLSLAPGTYRLVFKNLVNPAPSTGPKFAWRAIGDVTDDPNPKSQMATVTLGQFNVVVIRVEKQPSP